MDNKELLNEETYQKNNQKVKKVGKILLIIGAIVLALGVVFLVLGFAKFGNTATETMRMTEFDMGATADKTFGSIGLVAVGGFLNFIGWGLVIAGGIMMLISHRREIKAYTTQQVMPVAQEGINKMAPTVGNAAKEIAKGIKEGINEADAKKNEE